MKRLEKITRYLKDDANSKVIRNLMLIVILAANLIGVLAGLWFYSDQLLDTPILLWIFVPDCPLYVLFAILIIMGWVKDGGFSFLTAIGMIKYGLWTLFVFLSQSQYYFLPDALPITILFSLGHIGMIMGGLSFLPRKKIGALALLAIVCWFFLNDISDLSFGTIARIPENGMETVKLFSFVETAVLIPLLYAFRKNIMDNKYLGIIGKYIPSQ